MCGITGFIGPGNRDVLAKMMAAIAHRGPDDAGMYLEPSQSVFLGHQRLEIVDIAGGKQPFSSEDGTLTLVFNGEIYNHLELRKELQGLGFTFQTDHSDTETLLLAYRAWGPAMLPKLNGMWAFAIYDSEHQSLFCSRDRFGQKPLYYACYPNGFAFASELTPLLLHPEVPKHQDVMGIRKYYAYGYFPAPWTPFEAIRKLPAGHQILLNLGESKPRIEKWWQFDLEPQELFRTEAEGAEQLLELLKKAIQRRLMADVPLGILLSGGIDSTTLAVFANQLSATPLASFALGFEQKSFDERTFARQAAAHAGTQHYETQLSWVDAAASMATLVHQLDEPLGDSSLVPTAHICQFAKQRVKVALGGDGADELWAGYDPFLALAKAKAYAAITPKPIHQALKLLVSWLPVSHHNMTLGFRLTKTLQGLDLARPLFIPGWMAPLAPADLQDMFSSPIDPELLYQEAIQAWSDEPKNDCVGQALQFFTRLYLADGILTKVDRASMMHSLEVRSPFLDIELVNFTRKLHHHFKLRGSTTKYLLKKAVAPHLPQTVLTRSKKGFGMPVGAWFQQGQLSFPKCSVGFTHNAAKANALFQEHRMGNKDHRLFLWSYWVHCQVLERQQKLLEPHPGMRN